MKNTRWNFKNINVTDNKLANATGIYLDKDILSILHSRNIRTKDEIVKVLNPSLFHVG